MSGTFRRFENNASKLNLGTAIRAPLLINGRLT